MKKLLIAACVIAAVGGAYFWQQTVGQNSQMTGIAGVNGRLELERLDIASLYAGRVEELLVEEGDYVEKGDVLARLSSSQIQSRVEASLAQIASADAQVENAKAQKQRAEETVAKTTSEINAQQQQLAVSKLELENARKLRRDNLVSASELERRQANYKAALATLETAKMAKAEAQATVTQANAMISQAQALVEQAKADSAGALSQHEDMLIRAPKAGRVEYRVAEVGNVLGVGGRVVSLLDISDVYIHIFLPSYQSNRLQIGDEARIKIDGSDIIFPAVIRYVASEAQFTPKSVETSEERTKLMFKVKLQIPADIAKQHSNLLKGGMTAMGYVKYDVNASWADNLAVKLP